MRVRLRPVAVQICVVHVGQVFFALRWTGVISHIVGGDAGNKRGRQGGLDGGGRDGGIV